MLGYYLARTKNKFTKTTFLILVASMIVPFQALMIPFIGIWSKFVSLNNQAALIFFYQGFGVALSPRGCRSQQTEGSGELLGTAGSVSSTRGRAAIGSAGRRKPR